MKSYYLKGYFNGDSRNCRNFNSTTQNTICHYVIFRGNDCDSLLNNNKSDVELYQDSSFHTRFDVISRPNIDDINVTSSNCSNIVNQYGGEFENYVEYIFGNLIGLVVLISALVMLIGSIIRRHL